jgi:uncharacterized membrane protein
MTLLVLEIAVPQLTHSEVAAGELPKQLSELWPLIMSYGMSFIILGFFWIYHHVLFHYIKRVNRVFVWLTIFYLMFVAFIPFSTALLGEYHDQHISVAIYGINIAIAAFSTFVQWWYATKDQRLVDSNLDPTFIKILSRSSPLSVTIIITIIILIPTLKSIILYLF